MDTETASVEGFRTERFGPGFTPSPARVLVFCVFVCLSVTAVCNARVTCIRLTCDHIADTTDLKRFRDFHLWKDKTGNELAIAIWRYLSDYETGLYHFNEILEGPDPFDEYATVRDPLKILNTYNMAYCGIFGPVLDGIFQGVGFRRGRSFGLEAWNHCATEVWYDDSWHYFDLDLRGVLLRADGTAASLAEAQSRRELWTNPPLPVEPFFPKDRDKTKVFDIYNGSPVHYYYRWFEMGHTMDFSLRQGESFTRFWKPQDDRWHHLQRYSKTKWVRELIEQKPRGPKPNHRDFTSWNHGNGLFEYVPALTKDFTDFEDGYYGLKNLRPGEKGLEIIHDGQAQVTFEVFTPYVIVPKVKDLDRASDDEEASVVVVKGSLPIKVLVSLDHGLSWRAAGKTQRDRKRALDLTSIVKGTYGHLLKLETFGRAGSTAIDTLRIRTWVQVAPTSIPALRKGRTTFQYGSGDRYGQRTIPMLVTPNIADPEDLRRHVLTMPADYDPKRHTCRVRGELILRLTAPPDTRISWLTVGATFRTHQGPQAGNTDNRISYAVGERHNFTQIYASDVPTWVNHWRYNWDEDIVLSEPAEVVYVKYTAKTGLNTIRACLHLLPPRSGSRLRRDERRAAQERLNIVHGYRVNGELVSAKRVVTSPTSYTLECAGEPENVYLKMAVPHRSALSDKSHVRPSHRAEKPPKEIQPFFGPPAEFAGDFGAYKSPLIFHDGTRANTPADWQRRREEILATWRGVTGSWPALIEKPRIRYVEQKRRDSFTQHRTSIEIAPNAQTVAGYLLVPDGDGPFPAVLVVYYDAETGAGLGKELRDFGYQLAKRGFVALSIGTPEFSSLKPPYKPLCKQSEEEPPLQPLSALAYVAANCHNALANMPKVDAERIGVVGHSYGGKWAMFASCLYEEFACAVWSDPGIVFDESRANINYWEPWYLGYESGRQRKRGIPSSANPRTGAYKELICNGHDLHELHALMARRPFLVSGGAEDPPKRWKALNHTRAVNELLGYSNRVAMTNRKTHGPTPESNNQIYAFFEYFLKSDR
jgi:dienelactone hydrolase